MATLTLVVGGMNSLWAQVTDVSDKLVASGTNWSTFTSEKTGSSDNKPWQGNNNVSVGDVKGACTMSDFKFAEVYYDKTTGSKYTVSQTIDNLDNGIYKFRIAAFARKQNIWGDDNGKSDANNVRLKANNSSTYITSNVMAYYELVTEVTDGTLTISISGVDDSNKSNWMGYTDASLLKLFTGSNYPADVTGLITNPSFDNGTNTGWTTTTSVNGNNQAWNSTCWEYWSYTPGDGGFDYYQTITGLPNGRYTVSAKMFNDQVQKEGDSFQAAAGLYATSGATTVMKLVDVQGSTLNKYTTDEIVVTNGTLRIGAKNDPDKTMTARWFVMDEFELTYIGPVVESGTYYLYDASNEVFASRGKNNGTRMVVDKYGIPVKWDNWSQRIQFVDNNDYYLFFDDTPSASWIYTDKEDKAQYFNYFAFVPTDGGFYLKDNNQTAFAKNDGNVITVTTTQAEATKWMLKNNTQHDAIVGLYPTDNKNAIITAAALSSETDALGLETWLEANRAAKDKTSSVGTAKFTGAAGDWTWTATRENFANSAINYGTDYAEAFQRSGEWSQTINNLDNGLYKVTVNAFERASSYEICNTLGTIGYQPVTTYFEANGQKVQLKSWYSEKTETNNPDNTSQAVTAFNSDKYKNEVYAYVSNGTLTLKLVKPSCIWSSWVLFNNVTLTFYDTNVSDEDATAILNEADTQIEKPMQVNLKNAISSARSTFDGNRTVPNYNALRAAIDASATSVDSYQAMKTNYLDPLKNVIDCNNFYSSTAKGTVYDAYLAQYTQGTISNADALALNWKNGNRYETAVNNLLMDNWTIGNTAATTNNSGLYINTWSTENKGTDNAADFANPFYEYWVSSGSLPATTLVGTLTGLTANTAYSVTANVRVQGSSKVAGSITMEVVGGAPVDVTDGNAIMDGETATGRYIKSYTATGVTDGDGNLVLKFNVEANSNVSWLAFRDVNYAMSDATISDDFSELNTAISTAEGNTLGFELGKYAPYNNVDALKALSKAKAIDQNHKYINTAIEAATSALNNASWTANTTEVNAIYDGTFAATYSHSGNVQPTGWTGGTGHDNATDVRYMWNVSSDEGLAATTNSTALFTKYDAYYGKAEGYTMPLKANTTYKLTFKYGTWGTGDDQTKGDAYVQMEDGNGNTITINPSSLALTTEQRGANASTEKWYDFTGYFTTTDAGNYVLDLLKTTTSQQNQYVYGDIELKKAVAEDVTMDEAVAYTPAYTYANVTLKRKFTADVWNTFCVPFDIDNATLKAQFGDEVEVSTASLTNEAVTFTKMPTPEISANTPVIIKVPNASTTQFAFDGVMIKTEDAKVIGTNAEFVGNYAGQISLSDGWYYIAKNQLKMANGTQTMKGFRAYFKTTTPGARLSMFIDGEDTTTGIDGVEVAPLMEGSVYNLNGQRVDKAQRGLYIVNGKKIVVK